MKLSRIKVNDDFRSLKSGFELNFLLDTPTDKFEPYVIVGRNGSGKSNILELLGAIFYNLELRCLNFLPDVFEDEEREDKIDTKVQSPNAYELEYFINSFHIVIKKQNNEYAEIIKDGEKILSKEELRKILPKYIVGYSSGENEILSLPFFKMRFIQYDEYLNYLTNEISYQTPESGLVYLDNIFSQAIFLTNFLLSDETVLKIFEDDLDIKSVKQFRIILKQNYLEKMSEEYLYTTDKKIDIELTSGLQSKIDFLISCSTLHNKDESTQELIIDFYIDDTLKDAFKKFFGTGLELFQLFETLILLNQYQADDELKDKIYKSNSLYAKARIPILPWEDRIFKFKDFWIDKNDNRILSKSLSDGEHQFLHTIGLALLYKNTSSLFLLDEPETHFNPAWRAKYISTLRACFKGDAISPEVLITSHSPFIVSDSRRENVLIFEKDEKNEVKCSRPEFNTFGASVNKITMGIFEQTDTIGDYAVTKLDELRARLSKGESKEVLISDANKLLGDSVEKMLFINEILDKDS